MIEIKKLSGILNFDDKETDVLQHQHIDGLNIRAYGGDRGVTIENIVGNTLVPNALLPAGSNECIGGYYDGVKQRVIWGNWNSNNRHGIYQYSILTGLITPLLICFTNSQTDILGFDRDYPMCDADIIYTTEDDGDIFGWNCRNKRPKALNLKQAVANTYGSNWLESYLDVAKEPPSIPIKCAYENDATVVVNNLRRKLFKFKYRYWYRDNQKSSWSTHSELPVPFNYTNPETDTDPTKNCRIGCVIQTGDISVVKVEIAAVENLGNVFSNFFSVKILDKSQLTIPNNDTYVFWFYNSEVYDFIDLDESILLFDKVPDRANAQALLNGKVRAYGGITEGLDPVVPIVSIGVGTEYPLAIDYTNIMSVTQYGTNGFVTGNAIRFTVIGNIRRGQTFYALVSVGATTFTITYTAVVGDTPATVLIGLSASATGQGFTQSSINANELVIIRANQILLNSNISTTEQSIIGTFTLATSTKTLTITNGATYLSLFTKGVQFYIYSTFTNYALLTVVSSVVVGANLVITLESVQGNEAIISTIFFVNPVNSSIPAYNHSSKENWCLFYYDEKGKTNQANTNNTLNVATLPMGILNNGSFSLLYLTPYINAQISHRPPIWAKTWQWGRSENLTKQSYLSWVSSGTFKDDKYAYVSIESINAYKKINPTSIATYEFLPGDRIKFYILYNTSGYSIQVYSNEHDYEIVDSVVNPEINNSIKRGQFVKILLPTLSAAFNFGVPTSKNYYYYYIELYTPAKSATTGLEVYYEFGEEYMVIDAGLSTRRHQGQIQNQSSNLAVPATFKFNKGDAWYKTRLLQLSDKIDYDITPSAGTSNPIIHQDTTLGQKLVSQRYFSPDYQLAPVVTQQIQPLFPYNTNAWTITVVNTQYTFKVKGHFDIRVAGNSPDRGFSIVLSVFNGSGYTVHYILGGGNAPLIDGQIISFDFDTTIVMPQFTRSFLWLDMNSSTTVGYEIISGNISYEEAGVSFQIGAIDKNFSDFYESSVNSNGRPMKVNPDEKTNEFGTLIRWSAPYQQNTNLNQVNRFYDDDFDEVDRGKGDIQRLKARDRILRVFQNRAAGQYGILARFIQNKEGNSELITTNEILTKGNINYYLGEHGLGTQYTSLVSNASNDYFPDVVTGDDMRLDGGGFTPIGALYKGQYVVRNLLTPYNKTLLRSNGATAKILGCYDYFDEQRIMLIQGGTDGTTTTNNFCFSFNEKRNGYCSPYSYNMAEWIISYEDKVASFKNGNLWLHNNTTQRCNFYNQQYSCHITVVFNTSLIDVKSWQSLTELASQIWACPIIWTNIYSYVGQRQESKLVNANFEQLEGEFKTAFLRDIHSQGGWINGDSLKGSYLAIKFQIENASNLVTLSEIKVMYKDSPLNIR